MRGMELSGAECDASRARALSCNGCGRWRRQAHPRLVVRCGGFGRLQGGKQTHSLDLVFFGPSIADDGALYLQRRIFRKTGIPCCAAARRATPRARAQFQG